MNIIPEEKTDFEKVLSIDKLDYLEDGLQMQCAEKENLDYIVSENLKDFENSPVRAISTLDFLRINGLE